jgi:hypothetical protein
MGSTSMFAYQIANRVDLSNPPSSSVIGKLGHFGACKQHQNSFRKMF